LKQTSETALALILTAIVFALIYASPAAKAGAENGIAMCEQIIIPSLLPIMIITNIMLKSKAAGFFEILFGRVFVRLLKLPKTAVTPVIFGLIGGYPAGAVLTLEQYNSGLLEGSDAKRIMHFNLCGGVAFIINAVGGGYYKSINSGVFLYIITVSASFIIASVTAAFEKRTVSKKTKSAALSISDALCSAAEVSSRSVILMSAYIILFCAITGTVSVPFFIKPLLEITGGIFASGIRLPLPYCAFFLSFGGLCVHLQIAGILNQMHIKYFDFFIYRLAGGVLSYLLCRICLPLLPESAAVSANMAASVPFEFTEVNTALGIITMLGCAAIVLDIEGRKIKL